MGFLVSATYNNLPAFQFKCLGTNAHSAPDTLLTFSFLVLWGFIFWFGFVLFKFVLIYIIIYHYISTVAYMHIAI